ncbi:MAG: DUF1778 domain-containing protein [Cyanobacteria bacterium]|nr:DUF1778 domain-containing protein [Cyanobacteriota bacterium]
MAKRRTIKLSHNAFKRFMDMLNNPPADNPRLRRLLQTNPPWGPLEPSKRDMQTVADVPKNPPVPNRRQDSAHR